VHLFEKTLLIERNFDEHTSTGAYCLPLQGVFALKQKNGGKLDSHLWFFYAFAEQLEPDYTVLIDVGTIPSRSALFRLFRYI
jgi:chitin synthase